MTVGILSIALPIFIVHQLTIEVLVFTLFAVFSIGFSIFIIQIFYIRNAKLRWRLKQLKRQSNYKTAKLKESFEAQAETIYSSAIMGEIVEPILHDLASPISAMEGAFILLSDSTVDDATRSEYLKRGHESSEQAQRIIKTAKEMLHRKNKEATFSPSNIVSIVQFVVKDRLSKFKISLTVNIDENIKLHGVATLFERIVTNILINAIEELAQTPKLDRCIDISSEITKENFYLKIKDNGRGIKPGILKQIFDPDFSLKEGKNLGFGLAFVKIVLMKYFEGDITVESKEDEYTVFTLKFKL